MKIILFVPVLHFLTVSQSVKPPNLNQVTILSVIISYKLSNYSDLFLLSVDLEIGSFAIVVFVSKTIRSVIATVFIANAVVSFIGDVVSAFCSFASISTYIRK